MKNRSIEEKIANGKALVIPDVAHLSQVYIMCEIPINVILIDEFSRIFDGFSIDSNDLTQLVLGLTVNLNRWPMNFKNETPGWRRWFPWPSRGPREMVVKAGSAGRRRAIILTLPSF